MFLFDQRGIDLLQGVGVNRDHASAEEALIVYSSTSVHPCVDETDTLTLRVDNTLVPSAQIVVDLYYGLR